MSDAVNNQLVLISGESGTGKSASLMNIRDQEAWAYLNCEAGKRLPFRNKFQSDIITDPYEVYGHFEALKDEPACKGVIIDTITFLMEMFESRHIATAADTQKAWGDYFQFFKNLMQYHVAGFGKPVIILGHTLTKYDEKAFVNRTSVPVKGALKNNGVEAYFSTVVSTKTIELSEIQKTDTSLMEITPQDEALGYKHVFQTQITKNTTGERIRSPMGLFKPGQIYMANDAQALLDHLAEYYA